MLDLIQKYVEIPGVSGDEGAVRDAILAEIQSFADEYHVDASGNLIVFKKGRQCAKARVMLDAHMDEIGLIVTSVTEDGYLRFAKVGGIDNQVLFGKRVKIGDVSGVIGGCPVHLLEKSDADRIMKTDDLFIDIGAKDREDALQYVAPGDCAVFDTGFVDMGDRFAARALDDRAGCAVLTKMIQSKLDYDLYFSFSTGEEVGCRGAKTAAFSIDPQAAIVVEGTTACDLSGVPDDKTVCRLGKGAVISFMDGGTVYDKTLYRNILHLDGVRTQPKSAATGGNDAASIHQSRNGVKTAAISLPCRYIHSGWAIAQKTDLADYYQAVYMTAMRLASGEF